MYYDVWYFIAIQSDYKIKVAVSNLCDIAVLKTVRSPKISRKLVTFFATSYTYCSLRIFKEIGNLLWD